MIAYKGAYFKRRHELTKDQVEKVKKELKEDFHLYQDKYKSFIKECRENNIKANSILGEEFLNRMSNIESVKN